MTTRRIRVLIMVLALLSVAFAAQPWAERASAQETQAQPPAIRRVAVTITQLKPEVLDSYIALVRDEIVPAEKKDGLAWRGAYRPVFGEPYTVITVRPIASLAQFDQPGRLIRVLGQSGQRKVMARLRPMIVSQKTMVQTLVPGMSIESGMTTPANLLLVTNVTFLPGKAQEHGQIVTNQILPAYRKIGVKDYWVHNTSYGAPQHRTIVRPLTNIAELDVAPGQGLLAKAFGAEQAQKVNQQLAAITESLENVVLRLVPEISYGESARRTSR